MPSHSPRPVSPDLSIVIPVYNEAPSIHPLLHHLQDAFASTHLILEIIFVDDGSTDQTASTIQKSINSHKHLKLICLSRNFGQLAAINAGLSQATGNYIGIIDADLQDPPEILKQMYQKITSEKLDIVYGVRRHRHIGFSKKIAYRLFYLLYKFLSDFPVQFESGEFCLMSRTAINTLMLLPEKNRYNPSLRSWIGLKSSEYLYDRPDRQFGTSHYSWLQLFYRAATGIVSSTTKPLRLATFLGLILCSFAALLILVYLGFYFLSNMSTQVPGFATIVILMLLLNGFQFLLLGILGEYIRTIFIEVKNRPEYIIKDIITSST